MRLCTLPAILLLTVVICYDTSAQNPFGNGKYAYDRMLRRFVGRQAELMELELGRDSFRLSAIFSPCTVVTYSFDKSLDSSRYNFNQALAQRMNELLVREYIDTAKRNALTRNIDTVVSFNTFSRDVNSVAQYYSSSKMIYEECLSWRKQSGLSPRLGDAAPPAGPLPVITTPRESFIMIKPVLLEKDDLPPTVSSTTTEQSPQPSASDGGSTNGSGTTGKINTPQVSTNGTDSTNKSDTGNSQYKGSPKDTVSQVKDTSKASGKTQTIEDSDKWDWDWRTFILGMLIATTVAFLPRLFYNRPQSRFKVILIPMNANEKRIIKQVLRQAEHTAGFSVGFITERGMKKRIKRKNILYRIPDTETQYIDSPGDPRTMTYKRGNGRFTPSISESAIQKQSVYRHTPMPLLSIPGVFKQEDAFPAYYILCVDSPLLPSHAAELDNSLIDIIQYLPVNNYIISVSNEIQLEKMRHGPGFRFVKAVLPYSVQDIGFFTTGRPLEDGKLVLDILLHNEKDMDSFRGQLIRRDINIITSDGAIIRVSAGPSYEDAALRLYSKYVQSIYEYVPPQLNNDRTAQITRCIFPGGARSIPYTGKGEIVAVADTGIHDNHPDFNDRIFGISSWGRKKSKDCSDQHGHGTHVAGIIAGTGISSSGQFRGIAFEAKLFFQSLFTPIEPLGGLPDNLGALYNEAFKNGARIHNNSWSAKIGSVYEAMAIQTDRFVYEHKDFLIVIAAGNDGQSMHHRHVDKGYTDLFSITSPGTAKNAITVGASRSDRKTGGLSHLTWSQRDEERFPDPPIAFEKVSGNPEALAADSSRGPCWDGERMKPDIVAPGTNILSTRSGLADLDNFHGSYANNRYAYMGGTSMAAAVVAGAAALVREYYHKQWGNISPSAALMRATIINGTRRLTAPDAVHRLNEIPNYHQGFGMLDVSKTIPVDGGFYFHYWDTFHDSSFPMKHTGDSFIVEFTLTKTSWIRLCLAYADRPAKGVQLEFAVALAYEKTGQKWQGNESLLNTYQYKKEYDFKNNVAIIRLEDAAPGNYTIKVLAWSLLPPFKGEHFALVLTSGDNGLSVTKEEME